MRPIAELEKQQVGLRMPTYLLNDIDEITSKYRINRSEFLIEAAKSYVDSVQEDDVHARLGEAMQEVRLMMDGKIPTISARDTIEGLKDELKNT